MLVQAIPAWRSMDSYRWDHDSSWCENSSYPLTTARITLMVQVPNHYILTQNLYYNHYYPKSKYLIIGYLDPVDERCRLRPSILQAGSARS